MSKNSRTVELYDQEYDIKETSLFYDKTRYKTLVDHILPLLTRLNKKYGRKNGLNKQIETILNRRKRPKSSSIFENREWEKHSDYYCQQIIYQLQQTDYTLTHNKHKGIRVSFKLEDLTRQLSTALDNADFKYPKRG